MKTKTRFVCRSCGHTEIKWRGQCPACDAWNSLDEEAAAAPAGAGRLAPRAATQAPVIRTLTEIDPTDLPRYRSGLAELDRVLGGGLVPGSLTLVAGDPGVGKSTLLLQAAAAYAAKGLYVLYVSAEESEHQIVRRARRLDTLAEGVRLLCGTRLEAVGPEIESAKADVVIVDSVQTLHRGEAGGAPGGVGQVRDNTLYFMELSKRTQVPILLVGHVTKDGALAGPRVMEHLVDAVLLLEGDHIHPYRLLRATKNRFGATHETGVFEMGEAGLREVHNPSEHMLAERRGDASGSAVTVTLEGTRPILLEIQSLVSGSGYANPRRVATGIDSKRLAVVLAVLERRAGLDLGTSDVFVNVAGGMRVIEPAADLGLALAVASSWRDRPLPSDLVALGEVGLGGEVRRVGQIRRRIQEAAKLGFHRVLVPAGSAAEAKDAGLTVVAVGRLDEALEAALGEAPPAARGARAATPAAPTGAEALP